MTYNISKTNCENYNNKNYYSNYCQKTLKTSFSLDDFYIGD